MKRRTFLKGSAIAGASTLVAAPAIAQGGARDQVAADLELSEVARHHLRHGADLCEIRLRRHRRQIPDPDLRGRRDRARPAGARCREHGDRRDGADAALFLHRQGAGAGLRDGRAVRHEPSPSAFLVDVRRRRRSLQRGAETVQGARHPVRQFRHADGRLVPQGDQDRRRSQGPQIPHRRHGRPRAGQARHRAAADRGRRRLFGAREGLARCRGIRRPLRRREARLLQGGEVLLLPRLVGRRRHAAHDRQRREMECAAQAVPGRSSARPVRRPAPG